MNQGDTQKRPRQTSIEAESEQHVPKRQAVEGAAANLSKATSGSSWAPKTVPVRRTIRTRKSTAKADQVFGESDPSTVHANEHTTVEEPQHLNDSENRRPLLSYEQQANRIEIVDTGISVGELVNLKPLLHRGRPRRSRLAIFKSSRLQHPSSAARLSHELHPNLKDTREGSLSLDSPFPRAIGRQEVSDISAADVASSRGRLVQRQQGLSPPKDQNLLLDSSKLHERPLAVSEGLNAPPPDLIHEDVRNVSFSGQHHPSDMSYESLANPSNKLQVDAVASVLDQSHASPFHGNFQEELPIIVVDPLTAEMKKPKIAKMTPTGGSMALLRRKIIMEIVEKNEGVFPGDKELVYPFTSIWMQRNNTESKPRTVHNQSSSEVPG